MIEILDIIIKIILIGALIPFFIIGLVITVTIFKESFKELIDATKDIFKSKKG